MDSSAQSQNVIISQAHLYTGKGYHILKQSEGIKILSVMRDTVTLHKKLHPASGDCLKQHKEQNQKWPAGPCAEWWQHLAAVGPFQAPTSRATGREVFLELNEHNLRRQMFWDCLLCPGQLFKLTGVFSNWFLLYKDES